MAIVTGKSYNDYHDLFIHTYHTGMPKRKHRRSASPATVKRKKGFPNRSVLIGVAAMLALIAAGYYFFDGERKANLRTPSAEPAPTMETPAELLKTTLKRAYAVDRLFHQVINPEWEGASGAIGDAHLYAATKDERLLRFYTETFPLLEMNNGTWVDDRVWVCLAEMYWWNATGRTRSEWVHDAKRRYLEARKEGRFSSSEGYWSWYNYPPSAKIEGENIFTNTNMNQMATVACWLYEATKEERFLKDALLVWEGNAAAPGVERQFYRGNGVWRGKDGEAAFGKQFPWDGAGMCTIGAALYRATGKQKYRDITVATARRIMDPATGWVDPTDFYQLQMDGNGAFVWFVLDAYQIAPSELSDIPGKVQKMLEHVWSNNHGKAMLTLHRAADDGIRNGWNPNGGEDGYKVNEIGTVHPQAQAVLAFGVFASVLASVLANAGP